jgi:DegV family protein with EDD domain
MRIGIGISVKDYYKMMKEMDEIPKNAPPTPQDFYESFQSCFDKEKSDHIIYVGVSEKLSSTVNVARIASRKFEEGITIFNTESASGVEGLMVLAIIKLLKKGKSIDEILEILEKLKEEYILSVGFHTLENVHKSGRLKSKFILNLTKIIGIKPIAIMELPGVLKSRLPGFFTEKSMERRIVKTVMKKTKRERTYDMIVSHVENSEGCQRVVKKIINNLNIKEHYTTEASPVVGTNTGEGTIVVSLLPSID